MIISPFRTQLTRMIQDGHKNPERNMLNRVTSERPLRRDRWLAKKESQKKAA